jgi:glutaredoxin-like protein NrdH
MFKIFSLPVCPKCNRLKNFLKLHNVDFQEVDMNTPESLTELRINDIFTNKAPVLHFQNNIMNCFYTVNELFRGNNLDEEFLETVINSA